MLKKSMLLFFTSVLIGNTSFVFSSQSFEAKLGYYYNNYALANSSLFKGAIAFKYDGSLDSFFFNSSVAYGYMSNKDLTSYRADAGYDILFWKNFGVLVYTEEKRAICESVILRAKNGAGVKYYIFRDADKWSLSLMGIYDYSDYTLNKDISIVRASFRNKLEIGITERIKFFSIEYYQPAIKDFKDYLIKIENGIRFTENIFFMELKFLYNYESKRLYFQKDEVIFESNLGVKF